MEVEVGRARGEGRRGRREGRRRQHAALRDLRYWLASIHYNEIVSIQDEMLAKQLSARGRGFVEVMRATRRPIDVPTTDWRPPHYVDGPRWDAMALLAVILAALLLLAARLLPRVLRSPLLYKKQSNQEVPDDAELSIPVEASELVFPPAYSWCPPPPPYSECVSPSPSPSPRAQPPPPSCPDHCPLQPHSPPV